LLDAAGISKHNICFAQILLADINDFTSINEVYGAWVKDMQVKPARAAFAAAALPAGALVEIVVQAMR
jgi:2-iminobutanoate/2-iminopropanoate deaminase